MDTSGIFNRISGSYDALNHLFSLNIDKRWRKQAVEYLCGVMKEDARILDEACGTGDLTIALTNKGFNVTGIDISQGMLAVAKKKVVKCSPLPHLMLADAAKLPFAGDYFNAVTIAYGIRNYDDRATALKEIYRVLLSGGKLVILEFAKPVNPFLRGCYNLYFNNVLPFMARVFTGGKEKGAYKYFIQSVEKFPKFEKFCDEIRAAGFKEVRFKKQTFGISVLYTAEK
ncbi:MAG TPA: bifunctional demethylmenaquinone methyltransferase/2-methoxy-6-polyprenyl-1,4-benzoquinol methylase UbiE [Candidatus Egerieousia sp.]|nr:bifunctional demethylmenaquinone methyltransferase/2-methoxy-6-polyprenyl-1,4-benzoquinol methylase UbiE [Candidatus Egerieousia sp.]HPT06391.1 bifunctional demethylmenaquinone methyltransferase/2-methoxy-6-polyprenyl-1,4-benzoquinol methylase UbiE [Candidatus Egerieousia sp.]